MKDFFIKTGTVIVGDGRVLNDVSILIRGDTIAEIGTNLNAPKESIILDFSDRVILPGIIDTHVHLCHDPTNPNPREMVELPDSYLAIRGARYAQQMLEYGVTTIADAAARGQVSLSVQKAIADGVVTGPRVLVCGRMITITGGRDRVYGQNEADGPDGVRRATREEIARGADFIKLAATGAITSEKTESMNAQFTKEEMQAGVEEAHKVGIPVHAHAYGNEGMESTILAGADVLVHGHPMSIEIVKLLKKHRTLLMPTLVTYYESLQHHDEGMLPDYMIRKEKELFPLIEAGFRLAVEQGIEIVLGTDSGMPYTLFGPSTMEEMELMVRLGGMSAIDAIVAGTRNAARSLNIDSKVGTIQSGKSADIIVLEPNKDPLKDISIMKNPETTEMVILKGSIVYAAQ